MHLKIGMFFAVIFFVSFSAVCEDSDKPIKITPSGFAYYQIGQIEQQTPPEALVQKAFDQHFNGRLTLDAVIQEKLRIIVGGEAELGANLFENTKKNAFILKEAQGIYQFGELEKPLCELAIGYFPFKYNPEARNLGEYFYRSGTYPGWIITDFDFAKARLMGFKLSSTFIDNLQLNALFTSEYTVHPYFDYSLSFVAGYKLPNKMFDVGAGLSFDRIIPISAERTTSLDAANIVRDDKNEAVLENGDTLHYTLKGTKLMGRATFDPKPLLPFADLFGTNDLKVYVEVAVLGLKNYGAFYSNILERIPVMVGFNIPCFKYIDVVSLEMEYYGSDPGYKLDLPSSEKPTPDAYPVGPRRSFFKWSFYSQKTLTKGWAIKGLIGRDHFRGLDAGGNYDLIEHMNGPDDWHYKLRIMYSF